MDMQKATIFITDSFFRLKFFLIFPGDGVKRGFNLKRSQARIGFEQKGDYSGDVWTGETVSGQISITAAEPRGSDVYTGRGLSLIHI